MATSAQSFRLDHGIWNQTLYSQMREFWFGDIAPNADMPPIDQMKKWFGVGQAPEDKQELDRQCRKMAGSAIESVGPEHLSLPAFTSYEDEEAQAETIVSPFFNEVEVARQQDEEKGAKTLLSLVLLLDQMPRNLFREQHELPLVYRHYDRLAYMLVAGSLHKTPNLFIHSSILKRMYWMWFYLPFTHCEHLPTHQRLYEIGQRTAALAKEPQEGPIADFAQSWTKAYKEHLEPIEKFGRFPHRNQCLGRENTPEETKYLKTADTFGVEQKETKQVKDEL